MFCAASALGLLAALQPPTLGLASESSSNDTGEKIVALDEPFEIDGLQYRVANIYPDYFQFAWIERVPGYSIRGEDQYHGMVGAAFPLDFNIAVYNASGETQKSDPVNDATSILRSSNGSTTMSSWNFSKDVIAPKGALDSAIAYGLNTLYSSWGLQPTMGSANVPVLADGESGDFWLPITTGYPTDGRSVMWYSGYPSYGSSTYREDGDEVVSYKRLRSTPYELVLANDSDDPVIFPFTIESAFGGLYFNTQAFHKVIATFDVGQKGSSQTMLMDQRSRDSWCDLTFLKPYLPMLQGKEERPANADLPTPFSSCGISLNLPATARADIAADGRVTVTDEANGIAFDIYPWSKGPDDKYHPSKYEYLPNTSYEKDFEQTMLVDGCMILGSFDRQPNNESSEGWPYNISSFIYTQTAEDGVGTWASAVRVVCNIPIIDTSVTGINCWLAAESVDTQLPLLMDILSSITRTEEIPGAAVSDKSVDTADEASPSSSPESSGGASADGTYTASGKGIGGAVPVTVTIQSGQITAVSVGDNSETQGIGSKAIEQLPDAIVEANGTNVDGVAGATITSQAILSAVDDCLAQASR